VEKDPSPQSHVKNYKRRKKERKKKTEKKHGHEREKAQKHEEIGGYSFRTMNLGIFSARQLI